MKRRSEDQEIKECWKVIKRLRSKGRKAVIIRNVKVDEVKLLEVKADVLFAQGFNDFSQGKVVNYYTTGKGPIIKATVFLVLPENSVNLFPLREELIGDTLCGLCEKRFTKRNPWYADRTHHQTGRSMKICKKCAEKDFTLKDMQKLGMLKRN